MLHVSVEIILNGPDTQSINYECKLIISWNCILYTYCLFKCKWCSLDMLLVQMAPLAACNWKLNNGIKERQWNGFRIERGWKLTTRRVMWRSGRQSTLKAAIGMIFEFKNRIFEYFRGSFIKFCIGKYNILKIILFNMQFDFFYCFYFHRI